MNIMNVLSDIQSRLTERRAVLSQIVAREVEAVFPQFQDRGNTVDMRRQLHSHLVSTVIRQFDGPFKIEISTDGYGHLSVQADPVMTGAEVAAREAAFKRIDEEARAAEIEADKRRAAAHPSRAEVVRTASGSSVSIAGMIEDLRHWQVPPDLYNEESVGFRRALNDVVGYLEARARRG